MIALDNLARTWSIVRAIPVNEDGSKIEDRQTGYDRIPESAHDELTALRIAEKYRCSVHELLNDITAYEFHRRAAMVKALDWNQPKMRQIQRNRERRRGGLGYG